MSKPICRVDDCDRDVYVKAHALCNAHYQQFKAGRAFSSPRRLVKDRDEFGRKRCSRCEDWKPEAAFASSSGKSDGLQSRCRECNADIYRDRSELIRDKMRQQRFGLTREAFDAMLAAQGGGCAICGTTDPGSSHWHTDHDHACCPRSDKTCGQCVRGLLCGACNYGIGYMRDDVARLHAAIEYLTRHSRAAITRGAA